VKSFEEITDDEWLNIFQANVMSGVRLSRHYLPGMKAKNWGRIVFISSESGVNIPIEMIHYGMTKSAQLSISRGLAETTAGTNITVNCVLPGPTASEGAGKFLEEMASSQNISKEEAEKRFFETARPSSLIKRFSDPKEIGDFVSFVCSPLASSVNGAALRVDGGVVKIDGLRNMKKRKLGNSDLDITPVGFGAWAIGGGDWVFAWGPQDDAESVAAIEHAVKSGINWIDTAAVYGLGHSEKVVARALKNVGSAERPYVFTKCSLVWGENREPTHTLKSASIRREIEDSLRRLGTDVIDLYQIHWPRWSPELPDDDIEEGWQTLVDLKKEGKVRWIGRFEL
jgi:hypothetical protein